jgi:hypothetical protein
MLSAAFREGTLLIGFIFTLFYLASLKADLPLPPATILVWWGWVLVLSWLYERRIFMSGCLAWLVLAGLMCVALGSVGGV